MARFWLVLSLSLFVASFSVAQTSTVSDLQAVQFLKRSVSAMATVAPTDSVATGSVNIVAGSQTSQGTVRILTRGINETSVQVQTQDANWAIVFLQGQASKTDAGTSTALSLEGASTSQAAYFPLAYLAAILQNPDAVIQNIGSETLNGASAQHLRTWNSFRSAPSWQFLSAFTITDIWLDGSSGLPRRVSFVHRDGGGATPKILVTIDYSNYQNIDGVLFPMQIQQSVNGTPWMTVSIQAASFNTGLTDADFPVVQGGN